MLGFLPKLKSKKQTSSILTMLQDGRVLQPPPFSTVLANLEQVPSPRNLALSRLAKDAESHLECLGCKSCSAMKKNKTHTSILLGPKWCDSMK